MSEEMMNEQEQPMRERRYMARPKICQFCADKNIEMNYKNIDLLRRFVTEEGKIRPRRQTGTCARHQRALAPGDQTRQARLHFFPSLGSAGAITASIYASHHHDFNLKAVTWQSKKAKKSLQKNTSRIPRELKSNNG